jgi:hypothetical protein
MEEMERIQNGEVPNSRWLHGMTPPTTFGFSNFL